MLVAQNALTAQQASPTEKTMERVRQLLDYARSHKEAVLTYHVSDMVLAVHSNVGYLNESKLRSQAGGHFFLSSNVQYPQNNVLLVMEAELGALFLNVKEDLHISRMHVEMGHPQPQTPIQTDNSTPEGVVNARI